MRCLARRVDPAISLARHARGAELRGSRRAESPCLPCFAQRRATKESKR